MSGNTFGKSFRITTFGESHGKALGVVIDGCPAGIDFDLAFIQSEMDRRRPGGTSIGTQRDEKDRIEVLSGVFEGKTEGTPIALMLFNNDQKSHDYSQIKDIFRPGHADYTYFMKYGIRDYRGGGRSSGRETSARVAAGALAKLVLRTKGIEVSAGIRSVKDIRVEGEFRPPFKGPLYTISNEKDEEILSLIDEAKRNKDSLGGVVECHITGVPAGLGEPVFDKTEALLSHAIMSIGAVKGIEFGLGFKSSELYGSENNDQMDEKGFITNNAGGILGGLTTGEEIIFRASFKPTPSIARVQHTLGTDGIVHELEINGRHDPTVLVRAIPVVEAMSAMTILDLLLEDMKYGG